MITTNDVVVLLADHQEGIVPHSKTNPVKKLRKAVRALAQVSKVLDFPVLITSVPREMGKGLIDEVTEELPSAPDFVRSGVNVFNNQEFVEALKATGRKTLVIAGVATEIVVAHAALSAIDAGYTVYVLVDATGGTSERTEAAVFSHLVQKGVILTSLITFATALGGDFISEVGQQVMPAMMKLLEEEAD